MKYLFTIEKNEFIETWDNHIAGIGYFEMMGYVEFINEKLYGLIIINPRQCGSIEICEEDTDE